MMIDNADLQFVSAKKSKNYNFWIVVLFYNLKVARIALEAFDELMK